MASSLTAFAVFFAAAAYVAPPIELSRDRGAEPPLIAREGLSGAASRDHPPDLVHCLESGPTFDSPDAWLAAARACDSTKLGGWFDVGDAHTVCEQTSKGNHVVIAARYNGNRGAPLYDCTATYIRSIVLYCPHGGVRDDLFTVTITPGDGCCKSAGFEARGAAELAPSGTFAEHDFFASRPVAAPDGRVTCYSDSTSNRAPFGPGAKIAAKSACHVDLGDWYTDDAPRSTCVQSPDDSSSLRITGQLVRGLSKGEQVSSYCEASYMDAIIDTCPHGGVVNNGILLFGVYPEERDCGERFEPSEATALTRTTVRNSFRASRTTSAKDGVVTCYSSTNAGLPPNAWEKIVGVCALAEMGGLYYDNVPKERCYDVPGGNHIAITVRYTGMQTTGVAPYDCIASYIQKVTHKCPMHGGFVQDAIFVWSIKPCAGSCPQSRHTHEVSGTVLTERTVAEPKARDVDEATEELIPVPSTVQPVMPS